MGAIIEHNNLYNFRKSKNNVDENKSQMQLEARANDLFLDDEKEDQDDQCDDLLEVERYDEALLIEAGMSNKYEVDVDKLNDYYRLYDIKYNI